MKTITKYFDVTKLSNEIKNPVIDVAKDNNILEDNVNFVRKGLETYKEPDFNPGERSVITYISTGNMDRDGDIVLPSGVDLTYYNKHPVVMWGHNYKSLPVARTCWIKADSAGNGLIAKTIYASHPEADLIYNYRKDGFSLCTSIGFVPIKYVSVHDIDKKEEFTLEVKNAIGKGWVTQNRAKDVKNIIQKWSLIEFSDVSIPANPSALTIAVNKGLIKKEELDIIEDKSIQIEELKPYKTIIQIDGLKDMNKDNKTEEIKIEEKKEGVVEVKIEEKVEIKTVTPPVELILKEFVPSIEQKKADKKGNPSINDIRDAIFANMKKMREDLDKIHTEKGVTIKYNEVRNSMSYMGLEDLYPIDYPNGHVICCYCSDCSVTPSYFYDYKYKYDVETKTTEMGKMEEMEVGYTSKGICEAEIKNLSKVELLKSDLSKIDVKQLEDTEQIDLTTSSALIDEKGRGICLFTVKGNLYKTFFNKCYIDGANYLGSKNLQVDEHFSKFISIEAKSMEEWVQIKYELRDFYLKSAPGKEEMLKFCKDHNLQHKDYIVKIDSKKEDVIEKSVDKTELSIEFVTKLLQENSKNIPILVQEAIAKIMGKVQIV